MLQSDTRLTSNALNDGERAVSSSKTPESMGNLRSGLALALVSIRTLYDCTA
jgi:hypothetical protein